MPSTPKCIATANFDPEPVEIKVPLHRCLVSLLSSLPNSLYYEFIPDLPSKRRLDTSLPMNHLPSLHVCFSSKTLCKHFLHRLNQASRMLDFSPIEMSLILELIADFFPQKKKNNLN